MEIPAHGLSFWTKESIIITTPHPIIKQQLYRVRRSPRLRLLVPSLLPPCVQPAKKSKTPVAWCGLMRCNPNWCSEISIMIIMLAPGTLWWTNILPPFLMGKSTIFMTIFNCYVSSPKGNRTSKKSPAGPAFLLPLFFSLSYCFQALFLRFLSFLEWRRTEVPPLGGSLWGCVELLGRGTLKSTITTE